MIWYRLRRHPFGVAAHFRSSLVLTYAWPPDVLSGMLAPGLTLDSWEGWAFVAVAMVQTERLRPAFLPAWLGMDFFLAGYRIFARFQDGRGRNLRGLRILRSDTDRVWMVLAGNLLTHYGYRLVRVRSHQQGPRLELEVQSPDTALRVVAHRHREARLPENTVFGDWRQARKFAGPLPFTFDYERETHSMIVVEGVRENWKPEPVEVEVLAGPAFFERPPFSSYKPRLASAFLVEDIPYRWKSGVVEPISC